MLATSPMLRVMSQLMRMKSCVIIILLVMLSNSSAAPAVRSEVDAWNYLKKYGYVRENRGMNLMERRESFSRYLMEMQRNSGIEETGQLDSDTIRLMNTPRCGVADVEHQIDGEYGQFLNRYKFNGGKWDNNFPTYGYKKYSNKISKKLQRSIIRAAYDEWSRYTPLNFTEVEWQHANMPIQFAAGDHNDGSPFDGPGTVLAHASSPKDGDICFDEDENWSNEPDSPGGISLTNVAIHEIGHALGLSHSADANAIMYAWASNSKLQLASDDIAGIQAIYGARPAGAPTTWKPPMGGASICEDPSLDAMEYFVDRKYAFKGDKYYELISDGSKTSVVGPTSIQRKWPQIKGRIDATFSKENNQYFQYDPKLHIFQGDQYWVYDRSDTLMAGFPRKISQGFPGIPNNIDAAAGYRNNVMFIKGNQVYIYSLQFGLEPGYPKSLQDQWGNDFPNSVSAALYDWSDYKNYFFTGYKYYKINAGADGLETRYGRDIGPDFFNCRA